MKINSVKKQNSQTFKVRTQNKMSGKSVIVNASNCAGGGVGDGKKGKSKGNVVKAGQVDQDSGIQPEIHQKLYYLSEVPFKISKQELANLEKKNNQKNSIPITKSREKEIQDLERIMKENPTCIGFSSISLSLKGEIGITGEVDGALFLNGFLKYLIESKSDPGKFTATLLRYINMLKKIDENPLYLHSTDAYGKENLFYFVNTAKLLFSLDKTPDLEKDKNDLLLTQWGLLFIKSMVGGFNATNYHYKDGNVQCSDARALLHLYKTLTTILGCIESDFFTIFNRETGENLALTDYRESIKSLMTQVLSEINGIREGKSIVHTMKQPIWDFFNTLMRDVELLKFSKTMTKIIDLVNPKTGNPIFKKDPVSGEPTDVPDTREITISSEEKIYESGVDSKKLFAILIKYLQEDATAKKQKKMNNDPSHPDHLNPKPIVAPTFDRLLIAKLFNKTIVQEYENGKKTNTTTTSVELNEDEISKVCEWMLSLISSESNIVKAMIQFIPEGLDLSLFVQAVEEQSDINQSVEEHLICLPNVIKPSKNVPTKEYPVNRITGSFIVQIPSGTGLSCIFTKSDGSKITFGSGGDYNGKTNQSFTSSLGADGKPVKDLIPGLTKRPGNQNLRFTSEFMETTEDTYEGSYKLNFAEQGIVSVSFCVNLTGKPCIFEKEGESLADVIDLSCAGGGCAEGDGL